MNPTLRVVISGAGVGGLCAAAALLKLGIDVDVYEQATELREVGAGVQLSANGTRVLHALGVAEALGGVVAWRAVVPMERLPAHMARMVGSNWVGPGGHIVHYPLRGGTLMNFVGALERADWQVESWSHQGSAAELARDFTGWHEDIQHFIAEIDSPNKWALMTRARAACKPPRPKDRAAGTDPSSILQPRLASKSR